YGTNSTIPEVKQIYASIAQMSQQLSNDIDCNGLGMHYNRKLRQDWAYASTHVIPTKRLHFPDVSALFVTDCQINQTQANVTALQNSLSLDGLIKEKTKVDIPTASLFLLGNELTVKYTKDGKVTMYSFSFKKGNSVAVSQNKLVLNGVTYIPIYDKKTGKFSGFYNTSYQAVKDETSNGYLSLNGSKPVSTYYNGYLAETQYSQNYDLFPPNLLAVANEASLALLFGQAQSTKQEAKEDYLGKKLKLYISTGQNTKADLTSIAQACDKVGDDEIILWLHKVSSGVYRYEFYFGKNTPTDTQQREYYRKWLEGIVALPDPMSTYNPLMGLLRGLTDFIKSDLIIPPKYWDCTLGSDFVGLPFVPVSCEGLPSCMDRTQFAFLCGLYDGAVGQVAGIPEFISMLFSSEGRTILGAAVESLFSKAGWSAIINKVKEAHQVESCKLYHQIGKDVVDVATLVVAARNLGTLASKITYAATIAKFGQASELILALSQRVVYQGGQLVKNTY
uniref:hypothetical protein n=1 Tax=Flectobacillus sp. TaxID=50419 RepID=UPI003B9A3B5E